MKQTYLNKIIILYTTLYNYTVYYTQYSSLFKALVVCK